MAGNVQDFFFIRVKGRYQLITISSILYAEIDNQYISIVTEEKTFRSLATLKELEKYLPKRKFCKVHRAFIVALEKIDGFDSEKIYIRDKEIPLAYRCREQLISSINILTRFIPAKSEDVKTVRQIQQRKKIVSDHDQK